MIILITKCRKFTAPLLLIVLRCLCVFLYVFVCFCMFLYISVYFCASHNDRPSYLNHSSWTFHRRQFRSGKKRQSFFNQLIKNYHLIKPSFFSYQLFLKYVCHRVIQLTIQLTIQSTIQLIIHNHSINTLENPVTWKGCVIWFFQQTVSGKWMSGESLFLFFLSFHSLFSFSTREKMRERERER